VRHYLHARIQEPLVVAAVIGMMMRDDEVLDGLIGDTFDERHHGVVIRLARKFAVDDDQALAGDSDQAIGAGAGDHEKPRLHLLDGLRLRSTPTSRRWRGRWLSTEISPAKHSDSQ
jgi:hypothetical protein